MGLDGSGWVRRGVQTDRENAGQMRSNGVRLVRFWVTVSGFL